MISTYLQGGLGNYMFQIAVAESLAIDVGTDVKFSADKYTKIHTDIRSYMDNIFRNVKFGNVQPFRPIYYEKGFTYTEIPKNKNLFLVGYYQNEKYFAHNKEHILKLFSPTTADIEHINKKYGKILAGKTCAIHVRRGDYLKIQEHHPFCGLKYYQKAMNLIPEGTKFLVFSDDIKWCKENFIGDKFIFIEGEKDYIDMFIMSMCSHNIIANSSFSWWGAWLNQNENKIVVRPKKWFGPAKAGWDSSDVTPKKWIVL